MLAGTDAGTGVRGHMGVRGGICCSAPQYGRGRGERRDTHTGTHTGTYTRMLHLPFSDLPLKKCPKKHAPLLAESSLYLQSWRPSKGVPKPRPGKVPKKFFGKCRSETGCRGSGKHRERGNRALVIVFLVKTVLEAPKCH